MIKLETARLILRSFTIEDLDDLDGIFSKPIVMKYLGLQGEPMTRAETETTLLSMIKHWERHGYGRLAVVSKADKRLIGCAGLRNYEDQAELVYLIDNPYWGLGLATEIAVRCLNFGFKNHKFEKIIAFTRPANSASINVMKKIGMYFVKEALIFGINVVQYEILQKDFYLNFPEYIAETAKASD